MSQVDPSLTEGGVIGQGPSAEALRKVLAESPHAGLAVWVAPAWSDERSHEGEAAMEALFHQPRRLVEAYAAATPAPERDAEGEPAAARHALLLVERRFTVVGSGNVAARAATAALMAWHEEASLIHAPRLRINLLAVSLAAPPDFSPSLQWLGRRSIVTGQVLRLGPAPASAAPFYTDPRAVMG